MRRLIAIISAVLVLLPSCTKQTLQTAPEQGTSACVSVCATLPELASRASFDGDGKGALVNHWVVEVRDCSHPDKIFYRAERDVQAGVHEQVFDLMLVRNQTYDIAFWADTKGCYDVDSLTTVSVVSQVGNTDSFDAFCCCKSAYLCPGDAQFSAVLERPLAQVNFIATDLKLLEEHVNHDAYVLYEPEDFSFTLTSASTYNVFAGAVVAKSIRERSIKAKKMYGTFSPAAEKTTIYMAYVFTDAKEVKDVNLKFVSNKKGFNLDVTNVPLKENYRTNIFGTFFAGNVKCNITVNPDWNEPEIDVTY